VDFDPRATVEEAVELLAERAAAKGLELVCKVSPRTPGRARGDSGRIRQVLLNLVGNAIKFTDQGEVVVQVSVEDSDQTHWRLHCQVHDSGIGIEADTQLKLFRPFVQADGSTTRRYGGTGLGLAITRKLVDLLGGSIGMSSNAGSGSTFWFSVPLEKLPFQPSTEPIVAPSRARINALVVEDHPTARQSILEMLRILGVNCQGVGTLREAEAELSRASGGDQPYDLCLVDSTLPDGPETALPLAPAHGRLPEGLAVALLVPAGTRRNLDRAAGLGYIARVTKPVRLAPLAEAVRSAGAGSTERQFRPALQNNRRRQQRGQPPPKVLLTEDNPVNRKVAVKMLEKIGCEVELALNGREALNALDSGEFDLVFMDCQMPVLDGFDASRGIRAREQACSLPRIPIVAMTANAMEGDRERCLDAGMDDYIAKPVQLDQLRIACERWLRGAELVDDDTRADELPP